MSTAEKAGPPTWNRCAVFRFDAVANLATVAPCWVIIHAFDCRDYVPIMQLVESNRLVELYTSRVLSRCTCVAGLLASTRPMLSSLTHLPATFFRSLEFILEMCEAGSFYRPITPEDLAAGAPPPHWCQPLHMQLQQAANPASFSAPRAAHAQEPTTLQALALQATRNCTYWSLVHRYQGMQSKCDFNWSAQDLVHGLLRKSVSPYTLVLGLNVYKDRSLPWMRPSLFVPLAALLHQHQGGLDYQPVSRNDLNLFNTLGLKGGLLSLATTGAVPTVTDDGSLAVPPQIPRAADDAQPLPLQAQLAAGGSGSGSVGGGDGRGSSIGVGHVMREALASRSESEGPASDRPASAPRATSRASRDLLVRAGLSGITWPPPPDAAAPSTAPTSWTSPILRLLLPTTASSPPQSLWWLLPPAASSQPDSPAKPLGPVSAEALLVAYCQGLVDDASLVCGQAAGQATSAAASPPTASHFTPLFQLLAAVKQGAEYDLVPSTATATTAATGGAGPSYDQESGGVPHSFELPTVPFTLLPEGQRPIPMHLPSATLAGMAPPPVQARLPAGLSMAPGGTPGGMVVYWTTAGTPVGMVGSASATAVGASTAEVSAQQRLAAQLQQLRLQALASMQPPQGPPM